MIMLLSFCNDGQFLNFMGLISISTPSYNDTNVGRTVMVDSNSMDIGNVPSGMGRRVDWYMASNWVTCCSMFELLARSLVDTTYA
jgi:hypothetical protein